nr:EAL domain-containing protein [Anaerosolibacter carboniphilus]
MLKLFSEFDERFEKKPLLISVRRGLTYMIPLMLIGSMALLFVSLPIPSYQRMMLEVFGSRWKNIFLSIHDSTFNILSLIMVICISYSYIIEFGERYEHNVSPIIAASVSLCSFIVISKLSRDWIFTGNFGVIGIFIAMIVSVVSAKLFLKLSSIKTLRIKAFTDGANPVFNYALTSIYPAAITITVFAMISHVLAILFDISDIQSFISDVIRNGFYKIESPFLSAILFVAFMHIFWFFGMHGGNILEPVAQSIFVPALTANQILIRSGQVPTRIFTKTFFDTFVLMGGCGTALCLILAILIAGRHKNQRRLTKLSLIPVIFNINELIVFGIPVVLNPIYMIPFLLVPIILTITSFLAMYNGLVPYTCNHIEWTTPIFLSGYASTNSINGSLLQLFNLVLGTLCYIPFVSLAQDVADVQGRNNLQKVYDWFKQSEERGMASTLLTRYDDIGNISRFLAFDLEHDLQNNKITLFYQPQVDYDGNVFGVEALLRWKHDSYGYIYPPLIIALAEESQLIDKLGYWILDTACSNLKEINGLGLQNITVSVNISAVQLESDYFIENLEEIMKKYEIKPQDLKIEITEQLALTSSNKIINQIISIKKLGVKLAMDDFGMGHSSLMYLKEYDFDTIKLDGSLVREIISNSNCRNIISSIVFLCKSLNCSVIAEYVENEEQKSILHELGCDQYQGYLYSKAIPNEELIEYILNRDDCTSGNIYSNIKR